MKNLCIILLFSYIFIIFITCSNTCRNKNKWVHRGFFSNETFVTETDEEKFKRENENKKVDWNEMELDKHFRQVDNNLSEVKRDIDIRLDKLETNEKLINVQIGTISNTAHMNKTAIDKLNNTINATMADLGDNDEDDEDNKEDTVEPFWGW